MKILLLLFVTLSILSADIYKFTCRPASVLENFDSHKINSHTVYEFQFDNYTNKITSNPSQLTTFHHIGFAGKMGYINNNIYYVPHVWHVFINLDENYRYYLYIKNKPREQKNLETIAVCNARAGSRTCVISQCISKLVK